MSILVNIGVFLLIIVSLFLVLVVLAQRAKSDGGVAAMGGGIAEATFGADTGNVLSKVTIYLSIAFFVLAFITGLGQIHQHNKASKSEGALPTLSATPAAPAPAEATPAVPVAAPTAVPAK